MTQGGLFNPSSAQGDGRGYRLLGVPIAGYDVTALAVQNLVQGVPAGFPASTYPAQYPTAPDPNLYTVYAGDGTYVRPDADDALVPGRGFFWQLYGQTIAANPDPGSTFGGDTSASRALTGFALSATGMAATADVSVPFADNTGTGTDDFQMLANPFARPLAVSGIPVSGGRRRAGTSSRRQPERQHVRAAHDRQPARGLAGRLRRARPNAAG